MDAFPLFSIIIAVFNDWISLDECLRSLALQTNAPGFEVTVVDDGSQDTVPESIRRWAHCYGLSIVRQPHKGIAAARNRGVQVSRGAVLVFVDADCRFQSNCLSALALKVAASPNHNCFQLHLVGDCSGLVGKAEQLRLETLQKHMLQPDGCIRYLNTAGFAIRRARVDVEQGLFNVRALRAEDTLLLANLIETGELPLFAPNALIQHVIPLSPLQCLLKDVRSAYLEGGVYATIASKGVRIRITHRERLGMLISMWSASTNQSIGAAACFLVVRQTLQRLISLAHWVCKSQLRLRASTTSC